MAWTEEQRKKLPSATQVCSRFCRPDLAMAYAEKAAGEGYSPFARLQEDGQIGLDVHEAIEANLQNSNPMVDLGLAAYLRAWGDWCSAWEGLKVLQTRTEQADEFYRSVLDAVIEVDGKQYVTGWVTSGMMDLVRQFAVLAGTWRQYKPQQALEESPGMCLVQLKADGTSESWFIEPADARECTKMFNAFYQAFMGVSPMDAIAMRSHAD